MCQGSHDTQEVSKAITWDENVGAVQYPSCPWQRQSPYEWPHHTNDCIYNRNTINYNINTINIYKYLVPPPLLITVFNFSAWGLVKPLKHIYKGKQPIKSKRACHVDIPYSHQINKSSCELEQQTGQACQTSLTGRHHLDQSFSLLPRQQHSYIPRGNTHTPHCLKATMIEFNRWQNIPTPY